MGCTQQEVPNDQPIEENQENEQVEIDKSIIFSLELENGEIIECYQTTYSHDKNQLFKVNWFENDYLEYEQVGIQKLVFKYFENEEISRISNELEVNYNQYINSYEHDGDILKDFYVVIYHVYENDEIVSIIETTRHVIYETGTLLDQYKIFNIDKDTAELVENDSLVQDYEKATEIFIQNLENSGYCNEDEVEDNEVFYYSTKHYLHPQLITNLNNSSLIFVKDNRLMSLVALKNKVGSGVIVTAELIE